MSQLTNHRESDGELIEGRYRLIRKIGVGSMGAVFEAESLITQIKVAIKLINPSLQDKHQFRARFEREAVVASNLKSPYCAEVLEFGQCDDGRLFLVMELLLGESVDSRVTRLGTLTVGRALQISHQVLQGLAAVHQAGFIHRDIKPDNIFLHTNDSGEEIAKLVDFGIAKPIHQNFETSEKLTSVGIVLGTPSYIAPDWMIYDDPDLRTDLYSLAIVIFEMLTGRAPLTGDDNKLIMSRHLLNKRPALSEINPTIEYPQEIEDFVRKGWARDRDERFQSVSEMKWAVDELMKQYGVKESEVRHETFGSRSFTDPKSFENERMKTVSKFIDLTSLQGAIILGCFGILLVMIFGFVFSTFKIDDSKARQQEIEWWSKTD